MERANSELRAGVLTGASPRKRGRAPPPHRLSFAKSRRTLACELRAGGCAARNQPHLGEGRLLSVHGGLRTLLERLEVPDHAFACVGRGFEILAAREAVGRASIFAQAAEHATR